MKRYRIIATALAFMSTATAFANEHKNHADIANIIIDCNKHGAIITDPQGQKTYLGKNCDAYQPNVGSGRWWLTASAFAVEINGKATLLPVEVDCDLPACWHTD
ncbi:MAG: hypothetical protein ACSHYC_22070 [Alphaproteobacteria bacterium]